MNTPAHLLIGAAAFARPPQGRILLAALLGAVLPDLSLYLMAAVSLFVLGIPEQVVFGQLYYSQAWQTVFAIDNSFIIWGCALLLAVWRRWHFVAVGAAAGLLHLATDFFLHAGDGRQQFWPLSDWVFHSPVSYWDSSHHALWVAPVSAAVCLAAYVVLWQRGLPVWGRAMFGIMLAAEIWVARQWLLFF
ncbi:MULTISPECIES: cobalamin biosynthesis protein CobQ [unclassified Ruegeria]|uniref:cobalamin biosynthesis protein CobQ n=1 Tax=unclassified Ruegeria TaxID=2625375 RepID=UPI0014876BF7|nr:MULTISPECIES: cobalamin biosynthesis protein CobQ [unclassified Ruegeria]NOD35937.1 cobalamin biosynthesis protein CobQ [Ruegeria sp. HKCCD7296]NOE43329.1 cobalamin biosynthesis protein CobQ [Ruegeria sp. HKCCD7319]